MSRWKHQRLTFWRNASQVLAVATVVLLAFGVGRNDGTLLVLGACCAVLTLTFGRRTKS